MSNETGGEVMPRKKRFETTDEPETIEVKKEPEVKVNMQTFCAINKYPKSIGSRLQIFMLKAKDTKFEKTIGEWERMYKKAMGQ